MNKEIIVATPKQYKDLARKLAHEISKIDGCNGACWRLEQFEANEFQLGGQRYVILLGNSDENKLTKDFLPVIENLVNKSGACYGFDGTKAVIFGEGKSEQIKGFKDVYELSSSMVAKGSILTTFGAVVAAGTVVLPILGWIVDPIGHVLQLIDRKKILRTEQTKVALTFFLAEHFDNWIGLEK
jgi:hypothetical protein